MGYLRSFSFALGLVAVMGQSTPSPPKILSVNFRGTGCDSGTLSTMSGQQGAFHFAGFTALKGAGTADDDTIKNCRVEVRFDQIPTGYEMVVKTLAVEGHLQLASGAEAMLQTMPYWAGSDDKFRVKEEQSYSALSGQSLEQDFKVDLPAEKGLNTSSGCDPTRFTQPNLNINFAVQLGADAADAHGSVEVESMDLDTELVECPPWQPTRAQR